LVTRPLTRLRHRRKLEGFSSRRMIVMTSCSASPVRVRISSKVVRSSQASRMTVEISGGVRGVFIVQRRVCTAGASDGSSFPRTAQASSASRRVSGMGDIQKDDCRITSSPGIELVCSCGSGHCKISRRPKRAPTSYAMRMGARR